MPGYRLLCPLALLVAFAASGATPDAVRTGAGAEVTVTLVQIEVRVEDGKGNFVPGLKAEDFVVVEDGAERAVQYIDEYGAPPPAAAVAATTPAGAPGPTPAPAPREKETQSLLLVIDAANSNRESLSRQRAYLERFADSLEGAGILTGVFELKPDGGFELRGAFSRDAGRVRRAIGAAQLGGSGGDERASALGEMEDSLEQRLNQCRGQGACQETAMNRLIEDARKRAGEARLRVQTSIDSLQRILSFAHHLPGTRSLLLVSEGLDPGGASYFEGAARILAYFAQSSALRATQTYLSELQRAATVYTSDLPQMQLLTEAAQQGGVTVYWVNPSHSGEFLPFSPERGSGSMAAASSHLDLASPSELMQGMVTDTGGLALPRAAQIDDFYARLRRDLQRYYVISYTPARQHHDGQVHAVAVKLRSGRHRVRGRARYADPLPTERANRQLASALDFPDVFTEFPLPAALTWFRSAANTYTIRVHAAIPYAQVTPVLDRGRAAGTVHLGFALRDEQGEVVRNDHPLLNVDEPEERFRELSASRASLDYRYQAVAPPGRYRLTVAALDQTGGRTSARSFELDLPQPGKARCLAASPPLLARAVEKSGETVESLRFDAEGNGLYRDLRLRFGAEPVLPSRSALSGVYQIVDPTPGVDGQPQVELSFRLYQDTKFINQTPPTRLTGFTDRGLAAITSFFSVPYSNLPPGSYRLELVAQDLKSDCRSISGAEFRVETPPAPAATPTATHPKDRR